MLRPSRRDPDAALRRFGRAERGFLDMVRLEALDAELRSGGPQAVASHSWSMGGNRARIELVDGTRLRLSLYWQGDGVLSSIARAYFDDEVGWMIIALRPSGEVLRLVAFRVGVDAPSGDRGRAGTSPRHSPNG